MSTLRKPSGSPARRVLFNVPRPARDLEGLASVAYCLLDRYGIESAFVDPDSFDVECMRVAPDAIVLDILGWETRVRAARRAHEAGARIVVIPVAGLSAEDDSRVAGTEREARSLVDRFLMWGEAGRRNILAAGGVSPERVRAVGVPRFDFYHERYGAMQESREDFLRARGIDAPDAPVILWATNTPEQTGLSDREIATRASDGITTEAELRADIQDQHESFVKQSELVVSLARKRPEWQFIVKVHPRESPEPYRSLVARCSNIHIASNLPIGAFLQHCDVLVQCGCTTSTEAWLLGKPVLELVDSVWSRSLPESFHACNLHVSAVDEAEVAIDRYLAGGALGEELLAARGHFIEEHYYRADGRASERCAAEIASLLQAPEYGDEAHERTEDAWRRLHERFTRQEDSRLANRLKDAIGVPRDVSLRPWSRASFRKPPGQSMQARVAELHEIFRRAHGSARRGYAEGSAGMGERAGYPCGADGVPGVDGRALRLEAPARVEEK